MFDDRRTSTASPARSRLPSTARTKPPGASTSGRAAATCRARPSSWPKSRSHPRRHHADLLTAANHGGWNSDDNQNQQSRPLPPLGHRRPDAVADPLPQAVRAMLWPSRAEQRTPAQAPRCSAIGERRCPSGTTANDAIESLWKQHPEGATQLVLPAAGEAAARRTCSSGAIFSSRRAGRARRAGVSASAAGRRTAAPSDFRAMAGRSPLADDRPGVRQSRLAELFRHRPGRHERRLGLARRDAVAPANCSTGWPSNSWIAAGASRSCIG